MAETAYSCVATPDQGYVVRNERTRENVATRLDHDTARFMAWALAYRAHLWVEEARATCPHRWEPLAVDAMVCSVCGGFLKKSGN